MSTMIWIELKEYIPQELAYHEMCLSDRESLWRRYGTQEAVDFPTPKTNNRWGLTSQGWVTRRLRASVGLQPFSGGGPLGLKHH